MDILQGVHLSLTGVVPSDLTARQRRLSGPSLLKMSRPSCSFAWDTSILHRFQLQHQLLNTYNLSFRLNRFHCLSIFQGFLLLLGEKIFKRTRCENNILTTTEMNRSSQFEDAQNNFRGNTSAIKLVRIILLNTLN